jgi:hypothetical protein
MTRRPTENVLFPDAVASPEERPTVAVHNQASGAETTTTSTPRRLSDADVLFGESVLRDDEVLNDNYGRLAQVGMTNAKRDEVHAAFGRLRNEMDLSQSEARTLHTVVTDANVQDPEAWETEAMTWPKKTRTMLRERYGDEAEAIMTEVHDYIANHPPLGTYLQGGLEMNPKLVEIFVERVRHPWRHQQS